MALHVSGPFDAAQKVSQAKGVLREWAGMILGFPLARIQLSNHEVILTIRVWQFGTYLYFWWNYS